MGQEPVSVCKYSAEPERLSMQMVRIVIVVTPPLESFYCHGQLLVSYHSFHCMSVEFFTCLDLKSGLEFQNTDFLALTRRVLPYAKFSVRQSVRRSSID